jgi:hypothetical protein
MSERGAPVANRSIDEIVPVTSALRIRSRLPTFLIWSTLAAAWVGGLMLFATGAQASAVDERTPRPFKLVFDGRHDPGFGQANPRRRGAFTAAGPLCSSGVGLDQLFVYPYGVLREHTCEDGSGSFTAFLDPTVAEHGGAGRWSILGGMGRYSELRGRGTFRGEFMGGSPSHEETITFRTTWDGLVGYDDEAPRIQDVRTRLTRGPRAGTYVLRVSFRTTDDVDGNAIRYRVLPTSGSYALPFADARARSRSVSVALEIRPRRSDIPVLVEISAADPLGNTRRLLRSVALPR